MGKKHVIVVVFVIVSGVIYTGSKHKTAIAICLIYNFFFS